jgi:hypothetical protein
VEQVTAHAARVEQRAVDIPQHEDVIHGREHP